MITPMIYDEMKRRLVQELELLHTRNEHSKNVEPGYFEPGMMEYLDKVEGLYDEASGNILVRFESKGTAYSGRTELIEKLKPGDTIKVVREPENKFNSNNFLLLTDKDWDVGCMPATLCNAIAPLYDSGYLSFLGASASFIDPISKRSRYAQRAILFVELRAKLVDYTDRTVAGDIDYPSH